MGDIINTIPSKDINFRTKSLLKEILDRLELSERDRIDLQRYIEFGGGENIELIKNELENIPFEKGDADNSAVLKGSGNKATNDSEFAVGQFNKSESDTRFSIGIGTSDTDRKNAFEVNQNGDIYIEGVGGYDGTNPNSSDDLATVLSNRSDANGEGITNVTYKKLVELRDSSALKPGMFYRITDYVTTTTQKDTRIAEEYHQFDIIVTADNESTLNEVARAIQHDGDMYFAGSDLNAWQIWYCLDNDTSRFAWADNSDNGKGVIYRMIEI